MKAGEMVVPALTAEELLGLGKRPEGIMPLVPHFSDYDRLKT
jgi:hypothetical protein